MLTPIAIIGMGCRFPGARNTRAFWNLLNEGRHAITPMPSDRDLGPFGRGGAFAPEKRINSFGGYLSGIDQFDAAFFGIAPDEARAMDPQQRLMLEVAWEALEDAGVVPQSLAGSRTAVYVGLSTLNYGTLAQCLPDTINRHTNTGTTAAVTANRISYFFDLRGPSSSVDSACAASLHAVHLACQSLWSGEASVALAGGANLILMPGSGVGLTDAGMLSPDGVCRVFDAGANGWTRGEGAGAVLLKPLPQAQADGDPIYAVIRGSAVNHNGRSNGLTGPSRRAQEAVLRDAYQRAGICPADVQYIEAHSTGAVIGDAIELGALGAVLAESRPAGRKCAVGSLKPNIGHLEAAAGIAGLIKVALMLKHGRYVPTLNYRQPGAYSSLHKLPLTIATESLSWHCENSPRIAGVSAAGFGGTNVHVVLGEAPVLEPLAAGKPPYLFTLSARTESALRDTAARWTQQLQTACPAVAIEDLCRTANHGRAQFRQRLAIVADDTGQLAQRLREFASGREAPGVYTGNIRNGGKSGAFHDNRSGAAAPCDIHRAAADYVTTGDAPFERAPQFGRRVHGLPNYAFQRERHWLDTQANVPFPTPVGPPAPAHATVPGSSGIAEAFEQSQPSARALAIPARNDVERRVVAILKSLLNVSPIGVRDGFFDLGGSSLLALELFSSIEREFGRALPLSSFYASPTAEHLSELLQNEEQAPWDPLVTINARGSRPPLFFVPGLGGHAFDLRTLIGRLGEQQPVTLLHPQGLDPAKTPLSRIEEMAAAFLPLVRAAQRHGPYRLGGYSFGGSVAFEIACKLRAAGHEVSLVALLDAYAPGAFHKRSLPRRLLSHAKHFIGMNGGRGKYVRQRIDRLWRRVRISAFGRFAETSDKSAGETVDAVKRVTFANQSAWRAYQPQKYDGRVLLFRAAEADQAIAAFADYDPLNGWGHYAQGGVDVVALPCHHLKLFEGRSLEIMAQRLQSSLGAAPSKEFSERRLPVSA